jgi:hypothetical protein
MYTVSYSIANLSSNIVSILLILSIYLFCFLFRPVSYVVEKNGITIKRPFKSYHIELNKIMNTYLTDKKTMKWTIRTFGVGGLFGYYGKFRNKTFGNMTWYATQQKNYLIIETTNNRKIVLTPDDTDMIKEIQKLIGKSSS